MVKNNISISIDKKNLIIGIILIIGGIVAPVFINVRNFRVYELMFESLHNNDTGLLMLGAMRLVLLNSIRGLPHYLGAFIIAESTDLKILNKSVPHIKGLIVLIIIPIVYSAINTIHHIKYDLGVPAFIVIFAIMYLERMDYSKITIIKKIFIVILLLFGVQWLDIIPQLSLFGFGRGETSQDIKAIASIINGTEILTIFPSMLFLIFTFNATLVAKLINDEHKILVTTERNKRIESELNEARLDALQARNYIELKNLVHDLKTPLTSIQALVTITAMMDEDKGTNPMIQTYLKRIESSIDIQSEMISEILYEDKRKILSTEELFNYIFSHISHLPLATRVIYENNSKDRYIQVNKIRFTRAIINILDNSYNALIQGNGRIWINISTSDNIVCIEIRDDGIGIKQEIIEEISKRGFSSRKSTGLGLTFIKDVIQSHDGKMHLTSEYGKGTSVKISLSEVNINEYKDFSN